MQKVLGIMFLCFAACHLHGMNGERAVSSRMPVHGALMHRVPSLSTEEYEYRSVAFCDWVERMLIALLTHQKLLTQSSASDAAEWYERCMAMIEFLETLSYSSRLTEEGQALVRNAKRVDQITRECSGILSYGGGQ